MRLILLIAICFITSGCSLIPGLKMPESWKGLGKGGSTGAAVAAAEKDNKGVTSMAEANKKVEEARLKMELEYDKFRKDLSDAYKAREKIDLENFGKISEINYGIYYVTENKKDTDIDFKIANLKAKENMARLDALPEEKRLSIRGDVEVDRKKTMDELETKYKKLTQESFLAAAAYEEATRVIKQKEEEKAKLRAENRMTLEKLEAEKKAEFDRIQKETADKVALAKEAQRQEMIGYIVKALVGAGVLFLIIAGLLKNISLGLVSISAFGLAYFAATTPMWIISSAVGVMILIVVVSAYYKHVKTAISGPKDTVGG